MEPVPLTDFSAGKVVTRYFIIPDNFIVFAKYHPPSESDIARAKQYNFKSFYLWDDDSPFLDLSDQPVAPSGTDTSSVQNGHRAVTDKLKVIESVEDGTQLEQKEPIRNGETGYPLKRDITIYGNIVALLYREFALIGSEKKIDIERILKIASVIVNYISNVKEEATLHVSRGRDKYRLEVHSANTGILAGLTALSMNIKGRDILNIVCGALLHDIGILFLPKGSSGESVKDHTVQGFQYLKTVRNIDPSSVMPSLQHHERANGDGYPNRISLEQMEFSSRIVAICDSFDNQISLIKYGNDISIHFTKDELLTWKKEDFDPKIFLAFISAVTDIFKKDSIALLNSGELAVITRINIRFPMNPFVRIIADKDGNKLSGEKVTDLIRGKDTWISKFIKKTF